MNIPLLVLHLVGGVALGTLYFGSLHWTAGLFGRPGGIRILVGSMAARFILLGGVLMAASLEGALPLLATALGVLIARPAVLRWSRMAAS